MWGWSAATRAASAAPYRWGVINVLPLTTSAQLWNPILLAVSRLTGLRLALAMAPSTPKAVERAGAGEYDFFVNNHLFTPERQRWGWRVIARFNVQTQGSLWVRTPGPAQRLTDLHGLPVAFPSPEAFFGYHLPMRALSAAGVTVQERFAGPVDAVMAQLASGAAAAAGGNLAVARRYARLHQLPVQPLWVSEPYPDFAVMVNPHVTPEAAQRVRQALLDLRADAQGAAALDAMQAALWPTLEEPLRFIAATDADYEPYVQFWRQFAVTKKPAASAAPGSR
jgi:phosphonate transport system substrate-binding protein